MIGRFLLVGWLASTANAATEAGEASALERLATALLTRAKSEKIEGPVGVFVKGESASLSRAFSTLLIARVSAENLAGVPIDAPDFPSAEAAARKTGTHCLLRIELSLANGELRARGDLISTWVNFWSGRVPTRAPQPAAIVEATVPADRMALAMVYPSPSGLRLTVEKLASLSGALAAVAVGDINGDGIPEVVALTADELIALDASGRILGQKSLGEIPPSPVRPREPFGSVVILGQPPSIRIAYLTTHRAYGEIVAFDSPESKFRSLESLQVAPLANWEGKLLSATILPGHNGFGPALALDRKAFVELKRPIQGCSTFSGAGADWLLLTFPDGTGSLYRQGLVPGPTHQFSGLGAAATLVNLSATGTPQIASTVPDYRPPQDELRIWPIDKKSAPLATAPLGPGQAWYAARLPMRNGPDQIVVGILRPEGGSDLLRVRSEP